MKTLEDISLEQSSTGLPSIKTLAARADIDFGVAMRVSHLENDFAASVLAIEPSLIVPEYEFHPSVTQPSEGVWDFTRMDTIAAFASTRSMKLKAHAFVWHVLLGDYLTSELATGDWETIMENRIANLAARYPQLSVIDVCNECAANWGASTTASGLREDSPWYIAAGGPSYIVRAYQLARQYCPNAQLAYCDYGCEQTGVTGEDNDAKRAAVLGILETLANDGLVDVFSAQCHPRVGTSSLRMSDQKWRTFLSDVRSMGIKVSLSECDVFMDTNRTTENADFMAAEMLRRIVGVWLEDLDPGAQLIAWGPIDSFSWRQDQSENLQRPLPWDDHGRPKAMERMLRQILA